MLYMDNQTNNLHQHRYAYHLEVLISLIGLAILIFSIYSGAFGQTGGWDTYDASNTRVDTSKLDIATPYIPKPYDVIGPYTNITDPGQVYSNVSPSTTGGTSGTRNTNRGRATTTGTTTGGTGTTTTGGGTTGGNTGYGSTTGGYSSGGSSYYGQTGFNDPRAVQTQGGYNYGSGQSYYSQGGMYDQYGKPTQGYNTGSTNNGGYYVQPGIVDGNAVPTTGKEELTKSDPAKNVNLKNCEAFTKYHAFGDRGGDVSAIQMFLKEQGYYKGTISGVYSFATFKAVKAFQKDYSQKVLDPWGIKDGSPTGKWYKSTRYAANKMIGCPEKSVYLERVNKTLEY